MSFEHFGRKLLTAGSLGTVVLTASMCTSSPPPSPDPCSDPDVVCHSLSVSRHVNAALADARAEEILADATRVAGARDGEGDVACSVVLERGGAVTTFSQGNGIVNSASDFNAILAEPGHVKIVNQINWCGQFQPNIIGCAPVPGESLAVIRFTANQEGILWLHEFGHNQGLSHRTDRNRAVMFPSIGVDHNLLNTAECSAFRQPVGGAPLVTETFESQPQEAEGPADVRDFVRRIYVDKFPFDEAVRYEASVVPTLLTMLADEEEEAWWPNIVATLGILGDEDVAENLESFIGDGEGALSPVRYRGKSAAVIALGYVANRGGGDRAIGYLTAGLDPETWEERVQWTSPFHGSAAERNQELTRLSMIGLALSGREAALASLRELERSAASVEALGASDLLDEALRVHRSVSDEGLLAYYENP